MLAVYALKTSVRVILPRYNYSYLKFFMIVCLFLHKFWNFIVSCFSQLTSCKHEFHLQCILEWCVLISVWMNLISLARQRSSIFLIFCCRCQRSSQCPMCWQPISLKDPTRFISHFLPFILFVVFYSCVQCKFKHFSYFCSQELLEAVERERSFRLNPSRNATIFRHPTLGDFELQHVCSLLMLYFVNNLK